MTKLEKDFLLALNKSFAAYNKHGARSTKKLEPVHEWLGGAVSARLKNRFVTRGMGMGGEETMEGKYHPKKLDVAVLRDNKPVCAISFKFVTSNYKQNANNYFENLLGETANIRRVNVGFAHLLVLRAKTPYYNKNKGGKRGKLIKTEVLSDRDIGKYIKLFADNDFPHKPEVLGIFIIDINGRGLCSLADTREFSPATQNFLREELSLDKFINRCVALCKLKG